MTYINFSKKQRLFSTDVELKKQKQKTMHKRYSNDVNWYLHYYHNNKIYVDFTRGNTGFLA